MIADIGLGISGIEGASLPDSLTRIQLSLDLKRELIKLVKIREREKI
jgi:hypothetical protein